MTKAIAKIIKALPFGYKQAVKRVRELHQRDEGRHCNECGGYYPCPTIQVLEDKSK